MLTFSSRPPITPLDDWTARRLGVGSLSRQAIEHWQLERLREVVAWAREKSTFYRGLYHAMPEGAPSSLGDLALLPLVEHGVLSEHGTSLVCASLRDIGRIVTMPTSGSTGAPKRLWFTDDDLELTRDHFRHGMRALIRPGDRVLVLMPGQTPGSVGALLKEALARDDVFVEAYGFVDDCERVAARIIELEADCLVGVPSQILRLARSPAGGAVGRHRVKSVLLSGDLVASAMRGSIETIWDCRVFEHYGSTELGLGGAVQCEAFSGLHVREADLLFEVIDPETRHAVPDGFEGELVATTLTRRATPLIRYCTGDLVRMSTTSCNCGGALRCIDKVTGRKDGRVELAGGGFLTIADVDEVLYSREPVLGFTAQLDDGPRGDRLTILVDVHQNASAEILEETRRRLTSLPALAAGAVEVIVDKSEAARNLPLAAKRRIRDLRRPPYG